MQRHTNTQVSRADVVGEVCASEIKGRKTTAFHAFPAHTHKTKTNKTNKQPDKQEGWLGSLILDKEIVAVWIVDDAIVCEGLHNTRLCPGNKRHACMVWCELLKWSTIGS